LIPRPFVVVVVDAWGLGRSSPGGAATAPLSSTMRKGRG
jgi:hypothetical protein